MCALVYYTGGGAEHFIEVLKAYWRKPRQGGNMAICFNRLIWHGGYHIHLALPPPQRRPPQPPQAQPGNVQHSGWSWLLPPIGNSCHQVR